MNKLHLFSGLTMAFALTLTTGCPADDPATDETGADATAGDDDDGNSTGAAMTNGGSGMMEGDSTGADTGAMTTATTATTVGGSSGGDDPLPDGSQCTEDANCISTHCYVAGALGGICGECSSDADCDFGCSIPNPITSAPSTCNMGELGGGCETTDVCEMDLVCANILDVPGLLTASTCSDCDSDATCTAVDPETTCQPTYDVQNVGGYKSCVMIGSIPLGGGCDLETGDAACESGFCGTASLLGMLDLGVCSEMCDAMSCPAGEMCAPPEIDLTMGLIPGGCVPE